MDQSEAIAAFSSATGADDSKAREFLDANDWDVERAAASFFAIQDEVGAAISDDDRGVQASSSSSAAPAAGQTQATSASSKSKTRSQEKKRFASLRDLQKSEEAADDYDSEKEQEFYTGGDKSGLAVQDPHESRSANDHIQRLLHTARQNIPRPASPERNEQDRPSNFSGAGVTLGGDDVPSRVIPGTRPAQSGRQPAVVERTLHMWNDGFSVDDGPLYRYDDPANARTLDLINRGSAPLELLGIEMGQAVDVKLEAHRGEDYVRPKKKYRPFGGSGQRLGAPVPGAPTASAPSPAPAPSAGGSPSTSGPPKPEVDESQPTVMLQIRLADGTRLPSRFNTSSTIGDVYGFVDRASSTGGRAYALATTFPTKELTDRSAVLGDMAEFKRGGVIVQKWS